MDVVTDKELSRLEKLSEQATPGPWKYYGNAVDHEKGPIIEYRSNGKDHHSGDYGGFRLDGGLWGSADGTKCKVHEDAAFIAAAREAIPALIAEVKLLRKALCSALGPEDTHLFMKALRKPPRPNQALRKAAERFHK